MVVKQTVPFPLVLQTLGGLLLALFGYFLLQASEQIEKNREADIEFERRISMIEANRFTVGDGKEVWAEIAVIRAEIAKLPTRDEVPPPLFKEQVDNLGQAVRDGFNRIDERLNSMERDLASLKDK